MPQAQYASTVTKTAIVAPTTHSYASTVTDSTTVALERRVPQTSAASIAATAVGYYPTSTVTVVERYPAIASTYTGVYTGTSISSSVM
jgi:hypothetical protein